VQRATKRAGLCEIYVIFAKKDRWLLTTIRETEHFIGLNVTTVQEREQMGFLGGNDPDTRKNPYAIDAGLIQNI